MFSQRDQNDHRMRQQKCNDDRRDEEHAQPARVHQGQDVGRDQRDLRKRLRDEAERRDGQLAADDQLQVDTEVALASMSQWQLAARRFRAVLRRKHEEGQRPRPALLDVRAERRQRRELERRLGVASVEGVEQQAGPVLGQQRTLVADDEPLAELGHGVEVAGLRCVRERVDGVVVAAGEIVLGG